MLCQTALPWRDMRQPLKPSSIGSRLRPSAALPRQRPRHANHRSLLRNWLRQVLPASGKSFDGLMFPGRINPGNIGPDAAA